MNYFLKQDLYGSEYYYLPKSLLLNEKYQDLSSDAKIVWSILHDLQPFFYKAGWFEEESGRVYFYHPQRFLDEINKDVINLDLLKELHRFQLIDYKNSDLPRLIKYYLIKPDRDEETILKTHLAHEKLVGKMDNYIKSLSVQEPEDVSPEVIRKKNADLLKAFLRNNNLKHDDLVSELYTICIMQNPKQLLTMDYISEAYQNIVNTSSLSEGQRKPGHVVEDTYDGEEIEALNFMKHKQRVFDQSLIQMFNDDTLLILYKHYDLAEYLHYAKKFSLSILSNQKTYFKLTMDRFNMLLDQAFSLYDPESGEPIEFHAFFEKIVENQYIFEREQKLQEEVSHKLYALPDQLKEFTYKELKKALEHFPERYELVVNNLRVINTVYEDQEGRLPNVIYEKAFRRLFMKDQEIYSVNSFFKNALIWIQEDETKSKGTRKPEQLENKEEKKSYSKKEWLSKLVDLRETEGSIDKMSEKEKEEYQKMGEELEELLKDLED